MPRRRIVRLSAPIVAAIVMLGACGGGDSSSSDDTSVTSATDASGSDNTDGASTKPDVDIPTEIPTELVVTVLIPGDGPEAADGDTVVVDYVGVLSEDGTEFDNSYDRGSPFPVTLGSGGVIQGWEQGLQGAQAGSRIQLDIPGDLAYGEAGSGEVIGPNAALTFVIDVRAVLGAIDPADAPTDVDVSDASNGNSGDDVTFEDLVEGEGAEVAAGDTAWITYIAYDGAGTLLENSWESGRPLQFPLDVSNTAVPGLVQGVTGMKPGGRRTVVIPADQAFDGAGNEQLGLKADEPLVMVVDLFAIS
jgi:FKBP-type peptidyl-prolyl cis-trans isomerase